MTILLAGDTGGTKTILRLVKTDDSAPISAKLKLETLYEITYRSAEFTDLVPMVETFLAAAEQATKRAYPPEKACFAIAGPVVNNTSKVTNLGWTLDGARLSRQLNIPRVSLINDFVAVGHGVLGLESQDLHTLQAGQTQFDAPIAVIGAGTGLGEGFVIQSGNEHRVYPTEGGHTCFAPRNELEFQLFTYVLERYNLTRVSVERVVSGMGIVAIYQFLRDSNSGNETPEIGAAIRQWEHEIGKADKTIDPGAVIGKAALEGNDRLSEQTLRLFVELYGAEAGDLALKLLPYGGLYIAGGIAPKILPFMTEGTFMQAFASKGRMQPILDRVPVHIVLNSRVGLIGAALAAARL